MASAPWKRALLRARFARLPPCLGLSRLFSGEAPRKFAALWGNGDFGRLGLGGLGSRFKPTVCPFFDNDPPVSIACGGAHTLFLTGTCRKFAEVVIFWFRSAKQSIGDLVGYFVRFV